MNKNRWLILPGIISSVFAFAQLPTVSAGKLIRHETFPSRFVKPRTVDVWLPENYSTEKKFAVLYLQDGQMLFDKSITWNGQEWGVDETASSLMQQKTILPFIVVGVWNGGSDRHMEYCPQKPVESLTAEQQEKIYQAVRPQGTPVYSGKVKSDRYLEFLVQELKPFIDSTYSTRPEAASTFVAGSSMGGMISWYAVCEYPQVFGGAACLSTHWPGIFTLDDNPLPQAFLHYLATHLPDAATHKLYFDFGTTTLDAMYEPLQNLVDELLKARGYTRENWRTQKFEGEPHSEEAWQKRLSIPLQFLLGPTN